MKDYNYHRHMPAPTKTTKRDIIELVVCGIMFGAAAAGALLAALVWGA